MSIDSIPSIISRWTTMRPGVATGPPILSGVSGCIVRETSSGRSAFAPPSTSRFTTQPTAPSSEWCPIRTTVLSKFGSARTGAARSR
jgi:hypothetical protein